MFLSLFEWQPIGEKVISRTIRKLRSHRTVSYSIWHGYETTRGPVAEIYRYECYSGEGK